MAESTTIGSEVDLVLRDLALEAGKRILEIRERGDFAVHRKNDGSPVTEADCAADEIICSGLERSFPGTPVISEERPLPSLDDPERPFFLVDPLDGTRGFVDGAAAFTVNIALIANRVPVSAALFAPAWQRIYFTTAPDAAVVEEWDRTFQSCEMRGLNGLPLAASVERGALVSHSHLDRETAHWLEENDLGRHRRMALASSLKFGLLAEGRARVYPRMRPIWEWDTAAGHAIVRAAGGAVRDLQGSELRYGKLGFRNPAFVAFARSADAEEARS